MFARVALAFGCCALQKLQQLLNFTGNIHGIGGWSETVHGLAAFVDQKLGEVPFDGADQSAWLLFLQVLVEGNGIVSIHVDLVLGWAESSFWLGFHFLVQYICIDP